MGDVTIPWDAVTSVKSDNPLYVVLPGGAQANGKVITENGNVEVQSAEKTPSAPLNQVTAIRNTDEQKKYEKFLHPSWLELWAGYVDVGFAIARGNASTQTLNTTFNAVRNTSTDQTTLFFNQIYSSAVVNNVNGATANALRGGISYNHNFGPRFFLNASNTDETDEFQNLNFRFVGGAGVGFHAVKRERLIFDVLAGVDYDHSSFTDVTRNQAEVNGGDDLIFKLSKSSIITQAFRIYDSPADGQYRVNFDLSTATTLRKWLAWHITASDRYLSEPNAGNKRNDLVLTTGLRATFAR